MRTYTLRQKTKSKRKFILHCLCKLQRKIFFSQYCICLYRQLINTRLYPTLQLTASRSRSQLLQREHQRNNKLSSIGNKTFTEIMIRSLDGEKPGHQTRYKDSKRNVLRSTANDRAREGFRYWVLDKPVPQGSFVQLILINFIT